MLVPLTRADEVRRAFDDVAAALIATAQRIQRSVGYQGGGGDFAVYWRASDGIWAVLEPLLAEGRYWCAFGTQDPNSTRSLTITCEINPPVEGINRRCAGVFVRDPGGRICLAHSGKVGGGRSGIGKSAFTDFYHNGNWQPVLWPDKKMSDVVVIGEVGSPNLPGEIAIFVREVERFKAMVTS